MCMPLGVSGYENVKRTVITVIKRTGRKGVHRRKECELSISCSNRVNSSQLKIQVCIVSARATV